MAGRDRARVGSARVRVSVFRSPGTRHDSARTSRRRRRSAIAVAAPVAQEGATLHWGRKQIPPGGRKGQIRYSPGRATVYFPRIFWGQAFSGGGQIISSCWTPIKPLWGIISQKWFRQWIHCKFYRPRQQKKCTRRKKEPCVPLSVLHRSLLSTRSEV